MTEPEVLEKAPPHRSRRTWGALVALALLCSLGWYADHRDRARESTALATCEQRLRTASAYADVRLGAVAAILRPALPTADGVQQLHLADLMASPARRVLPRAQQALRTCGRVQVRPWHFALVSRRAAATAYSGALVTMLQTIAAQGRGTFRDELTLQRLRAAAGVDGPG
jgi:hypothetical protein